MKIETFVKDLALKGVYLSVKDDRIRVKAEKDALSSEVSLQIRQNKQGILSHFASRSELKENRSELDIQAAEGAEKVLSFAQRRLWFLDRLIDESAQYTLPSAFRLEGHLTISAVKQAIAGIIERHEVLRTNIEDVDGQAVVTVQKDYQLPFSLIDLSKSSSEKIEERLSKIARNDLSTGFNLEHDLMARFTLVKISERVHHLFFNAHHIAMDGESIKIVMREFVSLYVAHATNETPLLEALPIQYSDYASWQIQRYDNSGHDDELKFWLELLDDAPRMHGIPLDFPRPTTPVYSGKTHTHYVDDAVAVAVFKQMKTQDMTLFMFAYAAFAVFVSRMSNEEAVVVGTPVSGRDDAKLEQLVGMFVNNLVLKSKVTPGDGINGYLQTTKRFLLDAYDHQRLPFDKLVEAINPPRDLAYNALFQIVFRVNTNNEGARLQLPDLTINAVAQNVEHSKVDLEVSVHEEQGRLRVSWMYDSSLFRHESVVRFSRYYETVLGAMASQTERTIDDIHLVSTSERDQLLEYAVGPTCEISTDDCFIRAFEYCVERYPDAVAAVCDGQELSYEELDQKSRRLAAYLSDSDLQKFARVGICLTSSIEILIGIVATAKIGAVYVPLDPSSPIERSKSIVEDSGIDLVLVNSEGLSSNLPAGVDIFVLDGASSDSDWLAEYVDDGSAFSRTTVELDDTAYILYTSGSTGKPKGVEVSQLGLANYLRHAAQEYLADSPIAGSVVSSSLAFDATITTLLSPLMCGRYTKFIDTNDQLFEELERELFDSDQPQLFKMTPSHLDGLSEFVGSRQSTLEHTIVIGGENLLNSTVCHWKANLLPRSRLVNEYGPTETVVGCCIYSVDSQRQLDQLSPRQSCPIGKPILNTSLYVVANNGDLQAANCPGELYIGGAGVAKGYLNRLDLSQQSFVDPPLACMAHPQYYRTGDIVKWNCSGASESLSDLEFLGRNDSQIKVRGYRIEPGEIEFLIGQASFVSRAIVLPRKEGLHAVVCLNGDDNETGHLNPAQIADDIKGHLLTQVPRYMVPEKILVVHEVPLTISGKADIQTLYDELDRSDNTSTSSVPSSHLEATVLDIWRRVFKVRSIGMNDNFFNIGGHSLLAIKLLGYLRQTLNVDIRLSQFFQYPTISLLARFLESNRQAYSRAPVEKQGATSGIPLSYAQNRLWFIDELSQGSTNYTMTRVFRLSGSVDVAALKDSVLSLVERHSILRSNVVKTPGDKSAVTLTVNPEYQSAFDYVDLEGDDEVVNERLIQERVERIICTPFDLANDSLFRVVLMRTGDSQFQLIVNLHHIAADGWSIDILMRELRLLYGNKAVNESNQLPAVNIEYSDYSAWMNQWFAGEREQSQLRYWTSQLAGIPGTHSLPLKSLRPRQQEFAGAVFKQVIEKPVYSQLARQLRETNTTLFAFLYSVFSVLLSRYSNSDDVVVGTPVSGRDAPELQNVVGLFVNSVVLRTTLTETTSFDQLLDSNKQMIIEALEHQELPFERLVAALEPDRDLSQNPVFQILFRVTNQYADSTFDLPGVEIEAQAKDVAQTKMDLDVSVNEVDGALYITWFYSLSLFDQGFIEKLSSSYATLLQGVLHHPERSVHKLPIVSVHSCRDLLVAGQGDVVPESGVFIQRFDEAVRLWPEVVAVCCKDQSLSYKSLHQESNRLANLLLSLQVSAGQTVGIHMDNSSELMIALLACMRIRAIYVPLDIELGRIKLDSIVKSASIETVIVDKGRESALQGGSLQTVTVEAAKQHDHRVSLPDDVHYSPEDPVYILYTSGSTGEPNGVVVSHKGLSNYNEFTIQEILSSNITRSVVSSRLSFDATVTTLLPALLVGVTTDMIAQNSETLSELRKSLMEEKEDKLFKITPSHLEALVHLIQPDKTCSRRHTLVLGGERLSGRLLAKWKKILPNSTVFNEYGPTETVVGCCVYPISPLSALPESIAEGTCPIGFPISNTQLLVLGAGMRLQEVNAVGELFIGGDGVALKYLNNEPLSAKKFLSRHDIHESGEHLHYDRYYRTGDLVRWIPEDGSNRYVLEFVNRCDDQIKVRGHRIELAEINRLIATQDDIVQCVVLPHTAESGTTRLIAYLVLAESSSLLRDANLSRGMMPALKTVLKDILSNAMMPDWFVVVPEIPLNDNGKIATKELPVPDFTSSSEELYVGPRNRLDRQLFQLWAQVLGHDNMGIDDSFFDVGGHSVLVAQLVGLVNASINEQFSLRLVFEHPTIREQSDWLVSVGGSVEQQIAPIVDRSTLPLSYAQQRIWMSDQLSEGTPQFNMQSVLLINDHLDRQALQQAISGVFERHEILRCRYGKDDDQPVLRVRNDGAPVIQFVDLREVSEDQRNSRVDSLVRSDLYQLFDLQQDPLLRVSVVQKSEQDYVLIFNMHHISSDRLSLDILARETTELYFAKLASRTPDLPDLPIQYADYAAWQRSQAPGLTVPRALEYWKDKLAHLPETHSLPLSFPRPEVHSIEAGLYRLPISRKNSKRLNELCSVHQMTAYMILQSVLAFVISRYSGVNDIAIGTAVSGRTKPELENLIGLFVNSVVVRNKIDPQVRLSAYLTAVRSEILESYQYADVPFDAVLDELNPTRNTSHSPIFQIVFSVNIQDATPVGQGAGPLLQSYQRSDFTTKYDLEIVANQVRSDGDTRLVNIDWTFAKAIFNEHQVSLFASAFDQVLTSFLQSEDIRLADLSLHSKASRKSVVEFSIGESVSVDRLTVSEEFERQAMKTPTGVAVKSHRGQLTYCQLNEKSNRLAHLLLDQGIGKGDVVPLLMNRSLGLSIALLAVMKVGATYVPLDGKIPPERLIQIVKDSKAEFQIAHRSLAGNAPVSGLDVILIDEDELLEPEWLAEYDSENLTAEASFENSAYVIYTSGSTGKPKGVEVLHRGLTDYLSSAHDKYFGSHLSGSLNILSHAFDISVPGLFLPLLSGRSVNHINIDESFDELIESLENKANHYLVRMTPTHLNLVLDMLCDTPKLNKHAFVIGGESLSARQAEKLQAVFPQSRIFNHYGPTEAVVGCAMYELDSSCQYDSGSIPIGRPMPNTELYVLDDGQQLCCEGMVGELYIGGAGVARGYINAPELTRERFLSLPHISDGRLYRTGDLVKWLETGDLDYVERSDNQVKIMGNRVELGEISHLASTHDLVNSALALTRQSASGQTEIIVYLKRSSTNDLDDKERAIDDVRAFLSTRLPSYMMPTVFAFVEEWPLASSGKIDRKALPDPGETSVPDERVGPQNALETRIAAIWSRLLGIEQAELCTVSTFYALGGNSLLVISLLSELKREFGIKFSLKEFYDANTIQLQAKRLSLFDWDATPVSEEQSFEELEL